MQDDALSDLLYLTDDALAAVIVAATGIPATRADIRAWRSAFRRILHRARRARDGELEPPRPLRTYRPAVACDVVADLLASPEMRMLLGAMSAGGWSLAGLAVGLVVSARARASLARTTHGYAVDTLDCGHAYAAALAAPGGVAAADYALAAHVPYQVRAALRAATRERLAWCCHRLALARVAGVDCVLDVLESDGGAVTTAYPDLDLGAVVDGPPLGLWPPAAASAAINPGDGLPSPR